MYAMKNITYIVFECIVCSESFFVPLLGILIQNTYNMRFSESVECQTMCYTRFCIRFFVNCIWIRVGKPYFKRLTSVVKDSFVFLHICQRV